jgi:hypothetical protein
VRRYTSCMHTMLFLSMKLITIEYSNFAQQRRVYNPFARNHYPYPPPQLRLQGLRDQRYKDECGHVQAHS